jgi:hypothetical protein
MKYLTTPRYRVCDAHIHIDSSVQSLRALLDFSKGLIDKRGLSRINSLDSGAGKATVRLHQRVVHALYKLEKPGVASAFGGLLYVLPGQKLDRKDFLSQVELIDRMGFDGVKMIEGKPTTRLELGIPLDSPAYDDYFGYLEERQLPVIWHVGDPAPFYDEKLCPKWATLNGWSYVGKPAQPLEALRREIDSVLKKYPRLRLILAHFYFLSDDMKRAADFLDAHPSVCFDLTPGTEMYYNFNRDLEGARDFFLKYQDRLIYGTDSGMGSELSDAVKLTNACENQTAVMRFLEEDSFVLFDHPADYEPTEPYEFFGWSGRIHGIALPGGVLRKIYWENFDRAIHGAIREVNVPAVLEYALKLRADAGQIGGLHPSVEKQLDEGIGMLKARA